MQCQGCGLEKDMTVLEPYSHPETDRICDGPVEPLFELECHGGTFGGNDSIWKKVLVCHECFHKLDPDMWISRKCWESINPVVSFNDLGDLYAL